MSFAARQWDPVARDKVHGEPTPCNWNPAVESGTVGSAGPCCRASCRNDDQLGREMGYQGRCHEKLCTLTNFPPTSPMRIADDAPRSRSADLANSARFARRFYFPSCAFLRLTPSFSFNVLFVSSAVAFRRFATFGEIRLPRLFRYGFIFDH